MAAAGVSMSWSVLAVSRVRRCGQMPRRFQSLATLWWCSPSLAASRRFDRWVSGTNGVVCRVSRTIFASIAAESPCRRPRAAPRTV